MNSEALARLHTGFEAQIERITECLPVDELTRPDVEDLVLECLPPRLRPGEYLFDRDEVIAMIRRYYERNLASKIPTEPSDFFVPIELFDANEQCFRAWEIPRVTELLTAIAERCERCQWVKDQVQDTDGGDGEEAGGDPASPEGDNE